MKRLVPLFLALLLLTGCTANTSSNISSVLTSSEVTSSEVSSMESLAESSSVSSDVTSSDDTSSKSTERIYACNGEVTLGGKTFAVEVVQTEAIATDTDKYPLCSAVGKFDIVVRDASGSEIYRQNLNELYENKNIGYWGVGTKDTDKMHFLMNLKKTQCVFGVLVGHGQDGACIMFNLDEAGEIKILPVEGGYVHSDSMFNHMEYGDNETINHFEQEPYGDEYVWDGNQYVLREK